MKNPPRFSKETLEFIRKAGRQKKPDWLEKNRTEYEALITKPLSAFATAIKLELAGEANGYHFPLKGIGRLKRSSGSLSETGALYKDWLSYNVTTPSESRFDSNPNIYFLLNPNDETKDYVLIAGGLYVPSSRQLRSIRESVAENAEPFRKLFAMAAFKKSFPEGFSPERKSSRIPKGFPADHPEMDWIRLQAFFVWKPYKIKEFESALFSKIFAEDARQIIALNRLLNNAIKGKWKRPLITSEKAVSQIPRYSPDF